MNQLINKMNFKKATAGTVMLTFLSALVPNASWAIEYPGEAPPNVYELNFGLETSVNDTDNNPNKGKFLKAIRNFRVVRFFDDSNTVLIPNSERSFLNLEVTQAKAPTEFNTCNAFISSPCFEIKPEAKIYKYSFRPSIAPINPIIAPKLCEKSQNFDEKPSFNCLDGLNEVSWFVPSVFTYSENPDGSQETKSFSIDSNDCLFPQDSSLKCLEQIFKLAADQGIEKVAFPGQYDPENDKKLDPRIEFKTTSIPESATSISLLALGFVGSVALLKRKIK